MEAALLELSCGRAEGVLQELVAMHQPAYALALRLTGSPEDAEDIVQQAYLNVWRSLRGGQPPREARPWFLKVVANAAKNCLAASGRRSGREAAVGAIEDVQKPETQSRAASAQVDSTQNRELVERLRVALEGLDPESRALISLCYEQGCSRREAAAIMDVPLSTLSYRLKQILAELRSVVGRSGYSAAPAAIVGALAQTSPTAPAGLAAKIESLLAGQAAGGNGGSGAVRSAQGGGLAMKVLVGTLMAGVLAGAVAVVDHRRAAPDVPLPPAPAAAAKGGEAASTGGGPKLEHIAFASDVDYLDGPSVEGLGLGKGCLPTTDSEGNLYLISKYSTCRLRCVRVNDGRVVTIGGNDRWPGNLKLTEGPAAYLPNFFKCQQAGDYSKPHGIIHVRGLPLKGEDQGCIYLFWEGESPYRIFKNKEKNDRWWFKRMGTPGKAAPPTTAGQSAKIDETDLTNASVGNGCIIWQNNVYSFDEAKGEMTCILAVADYGPKLEAAYAGWMSKASPDERARSAMKIFEHIVRADDGTCYMANYWGGYWGVFKVSADGKQVEHIVVDNSQRLKGQGVAANRDGPGLTTTWHCGPANITTTGNSLFLHSIDSSAVRRWVNGRVSTLCWDGEWRETPKGGRGRRQPDAGIMFKHYQPGQPGANYIYVTYPGEETGGDLRLYRIGPADFTKPTVGPLQEVTGEGEGQK